MAKKDSKIEGKIYFKFNQRNDSFCSYPGMIAEVSAEELKQLDGFGEVVNFENEVKPNDSTE